MTAELPPTVAEATERFDQSDVLGSGSDDWRSDLVDAWGLQSFSASDLPANW